VAQKKVKSTRGAKKSTAKHLLLATWETKNRGLVCLSKDWSSTTRLPPLAIEGNPINSLFRAPPLRWGQLAGYYVQDDMLHFLLWPNCYPSVDKRESEKVYVAGDFNGWSEAIGDATWQMKPEKLNGEPCMILRLPLDEFTAGKKPCSFKFVTERGIWMQPPEKAPNCVHEGRYTNFQLHPSRTGQNIFYFQPRRANALEGSQELCWHSAGKTVDKVCIGFAEIIDTLSSRKPLGAIVEDNKTLFRIFAPRATKVRVAFFEKLGTRKPWWLDLKPTDESIWEGEQPGNLHGWYYYFSVDGKNEDNFSAFDPSFKILDPYAKAAVSHQGPGIILDKKQLGRPTRTFSCPEWHNLVIMETHVRDLLAKAPIELTAEERRGFAGLTKWLKQEDCYLRQLGVNAVELQPVQEFDNRRVDEYHWGYMTVNYFSPESSYGTDPAKGTQVREFQELVEAFHEAGIAVILDVVYNHVGEPNHLFHIDKSYYFEMDGAGNLSNWSGCGNDLRASAPMAKKLIIDSLLHLIDLYDVDGFRFDLAELIGVEVLKDIEAVVKRVKPSVVLIAEPWSFRGHIGHALRQTGYSSWNDDYRDFILKYVRGDGNRDGIQYFLAGSPEYLATWPAQTVNYTESHDDMCWMDKLTENGDHHGEHPTMNDRRRTHLMFSIIIASIGIPMIAEGQDMLRSKYGVNNTYQRGDLNALDYQRMRQFPATHDYVRSWIDFRLGYYGRFMRLQTRGGQGYLRFFGVEGASSVALLYNADYSLGDERVLYAINPHHWEVTFETGELNPAAFRQVADHERFWPDGLECARFFWKDGRLSLPPMSCGIWVQG